LTPDRAFEVLRRHSQTTNISVAVLADELTRTGRLRMLERWFHASRS